MAAPPIPTTTSGEITIQFQRQHVSLDLNDENYLEWAYQVITALRRYGLEGYITGDTLTPEKSIREVNDAGETSLVPNPSFSHWERQDELIVSWLLSFLSEDTRITTVGLRSSKEIWTWLKSHFGSRTEFKRYRLRENLKTLIKKGNMKVMEYLDKMKRIFDMLAMAGDPITESEQVGYFMDGLGSEFNSVKSSITYRPDKCSLVEAYAVIESYEARMESFDKVTTDLGEGSSQLASSNMVTLDKVNVANFVSCKLSGDKESNNYPLWKQQILYLIEVNDLFPYIYSPHPEEGDRRTEKVVLGWIVRSLTNEVHKKVAHLTTARDVWMELDKNLNTGRDFPIINKSSPTILSTVNVANFISSKLSGSNNYPSWQKQISCLLEANNLNLCISPDEDRSDNYDTWDREKVVLGWILGSLDDAVLKTVVHCHTAMDVWAELEKHFGPPPGIVRATMETEWDEYLPLVINIRKGEWEKAQKFIEEKMQDKNIGAAITSRSDTCLHLAMSYGVIPLVQFLVGRRDFYQLINSNIIGNTALHTAAWSIRCSQTAIEILVDRHPSLVNQVNYELEYPCHLAVRAFKKDLVKYFLSKMNKERLFALPQDTGAKLLCMLIEAEYYDVAKTVTDKCPELACVKLKDGTTALHKLVLKDTGKGRSNFILWERFLHSIVPSAKADTVMSDLHVFVVIFFNHLKKLDFNKYAEVYEDALLKAIENRSERIFLEIHHLMDNEKFDFRELTDIHGNTPLHMAASLAPEHKLNLVSGAALQMQREIQWFKVLDPLPF